MSGSLSSHAASFQRDARGLSARSFPERRGGGYRCRFADGAAAEDD